MHFKFPLKILLLLCTLASLSVFLILVTRQSCEHQSINQLPIGKNQGKSRMQHPVHIRASRLASKCVEHRSEFDQSLFGSNKSLAKLSKLVEEAPIFVEKDKGFFFCKVPKSGSTFWVNLFLSSYLSESELTTMAVGRRHVVLGHHMQNVSNLQDFLVANAMPNGFMTVRHPFERLFSAYNDKFFEQPHWLAREEKVKRERFRDLYGSRIISVYRKNKSDTSLEPSFAEFVQFLLNSPVENDNEHWKPISHLCLPCLTRYSMVTRLEQLSLESAFVLGQLNFAPNGQNLGAKSHNLTNEDSKDGLKAFRKLGKDVVDKLYERYKLDFLLFDFHLDNYREQ